jgi:gas vesicle protein
MKTIEQLQYQANSVKLELEALKKLAEATKEEKELKEKKTKNLTDQIASITLELNNRILVLKDKTDTSSLEELKKAEEVLKILDDSSSELTNLQKNVVDQLSA